ncbi:Hypothetical Protein RradSPS_0997 [Rubrobacter radiotolerans]|uniref:Uncharacterized protein n=1 Tax=Rubrobacter radiotolerans TaxID=42256 RepID=A0A023X2Q0_RUBRA|nr:hypothetical protein [Rubrobacter radiotolerans]AHY46280.1 Hypothetical Protein RradSPS_0997 [Rubrobacter radiotolerans]MDX5893688.1 hypothetical protein [Rubrobacter radiotolerans]SMC04277.1 hypothetical protein SAMN00767673_0994 [Rubrobacter radiotolerans DSM 5868]
MQAPILYSTSKKKNATNDTPPKTRDTRERTEPPGDGFLPSLRKEVFETGKREREPHLKRREKPENAGLDQEPESEQPEARGEHHAAR